MDIITYVLCDNDYGIEMEEAAKFLVKQIGTDVLRILTDEQILVCFSVCMLSSFYDKLQGISLSPEEYTKSLEFYFEYFNDARIGRTLEDSEVYQDGGSVSIRLSDGHVWRH